MSEIHGETLFDGVFSETEIREIAWEAYVRQRDAHISEYLANCDEIARLYHAECGTPEAMAQWCDSFFEELAAGHDLFLREYRSKDVLDVLAGAARRAARLARQEELARLARREELLRSTTSTSLMATAGRTARGTDSCASGPPSRRSWKPSPMASTWSAMGTCGFLQGQERLTRRSWMPLPSASF